MPQISSHHIFDHITGAKLSKLIALGLTGSLLLGLAAPLASNPAPTDPTDSADTPASTQSSTNAEIQECVVTFRTGRKLTGILMDSDDESVVLRINGIDTTYRRARISSVRFLEPIADRYRMYRESIPDEDIDGRLMLVDWLRDRRAYALALEELDSILESDPTNPQAKLLKTWLEQHLKLSQAKHKRPLARSPKAIAKTESSIPLLTKDQANIIRVFEIDLADPPKLKIEDSTIRKLITRSPTMFPADEKERDAILKWPQIEKLKLLFRHRARDLYPEIHVLEDPPSFQAFKNQIGGHTGWLINGCATARCHGGNQAGEFQLSNYNPNSPETLYTNFLILDQFELKDGTPLINHVEAERSPLMHLGLVRSRSLYPHPDVDAREFGRDWRAVFRATNSTNFKRTTDWIRSLYTPRPDYGFQYPPPATEDSP